jgi:hypothetical protein
MREEIKRFKILRSGDMETIACREKDYRDS